ncbi:hypothetical protein DPMN_191016 [Dreissena polymorpha]|uniref:Uncharacterized protein n=1 Tax=Dreissena polymorpha TaxID=45954 RepID=A0A9D3Y4L5_DREPO|nr:hypothetical protein DPMN_191016 [Dreissena polymorpha]
MLLMKMLISTLAGDENDDDDAKGDGLYLDILKIVPDLTMTNQAPLSLMNRLKKPFELSVKIILIKGEIAHHEQVLLFETESPVFKKKTNSSEGVMVYWKCNNILNRTCQYKCKDILKKHSQYLCNIILNRQCNILEEPVLYQYNASIRDSVSTNERQPQDTYQCNNISRDNYQCNDISRGSVSTNAMTSQEAYQCNDISRGSYQCNNISRDNYQCNAISRGSVSTNEITFSRDSVSTNTYQYNDIHKRQCQYQSNDILKIQCEYQ